MRSFGYVLIGIVIGWLASYGFTYRPSMKVDVREGGLGDRPSIDQRIAKVNEVLDFDGEVRDPELDPNTLEEILIEEVVLAESSEKNVIAEVIAEIGDPTLDPDDGAASYFPASPQNFGDANLSPESASDSLVDEPSIALGDALKNPESDSVGESPYLEGDINIGDRPLAPESI